jgi:hypothetical protein
MSIHALKPWTEFVKLHADVESGSLAEAAVMVYSLQWSAREALGNVALLEELDKLTSRKDQVREPVTGDEVLAVVKRRLLSGDPSDDAANKVAAEYGNVVGNYWRARAETTSAKQDAEQQAIHLKSRMELAYPFHPALIDVMNSRWTSVAEAALRVVQQRQQDNPNPGRK